MMEGMGTVDEHHTSDEAPAPQAHGALPQDDAPTTTPTQADGNLRAPANGAREPDAAPATPGGEALGAWVPAPPVVLGRSALPVDPAAPTVPLGSASAPFPAAKRRLTPRKRLGTMGPPLSPALAALVFSAALCGIVVAGCTGLLLTQGEWATAARAAGLAALLMGLIYVLATLARALADGGLSRPVLMGLLAVLVLGALGGTGLALVRPLHLAQARALEADHEWSAAIRQYELSGEQGPASRDIARTYVEWGDALRRQGDYAGALDRYQVVITSYAHAGVETGRAEAATLKTYSAWLATSRPDIAYDALLGQMSRDASAAWCDAACQAELAALQSQARYQFGVALAAEGRYGLAITQLEATTTRFPASPYAGLAHAAAARAYLALGRSQLAGPSCADAVPTFRTLATSYADTPEGAQAKAALATPVSVSGMLTGPYPKNPAPAMYLSRHTNNSTYFSDDYVATLDRSGHFTFKDVPPGSYNLSAAFADGRGVFWRDAGTGNAYNLVVGPLCPLTLPASYTWP